MTEEEKKAIELKHRLYYADYVDKNFIEKDKIREKIKEIENEHTGSTRNALSVLQELLEE